jgi:hypothetical protein
MGPRHTPANQILAVPFGILTPRRFTGRNTPLAPGYRRFCCRACGMQFNERSETVLNRAQYPSDVMALVVLWLPS